MRSMAALVVALGGVADPVQAEVLERWDDGFVVQHRIETQASPDGAWASVLRPADWWSSVG